MDLVRYVALITGGASGIGLGIAKELLGKGIKGISIVDINPKGNEIVQELNSKYGAEKAIFIRADVSDKCALRSAFQQTVDRFGTLDIVFNNAGIYVKNVETMFKVNMIGAYYCIQLAMDEFLPKYKSSDEGIIVNTSSVVALDPCQWTVVPCYLAAKTALLALTQCFSQEFHYNRTKVRIMAICPGVTATPILNNDEAEYKEENTKLLEGCNIQEVEDLTKHIVPILKEGKNGSIWRLEDKERKEIYIPKMH